MASAFMCDRCGRYYSEIDTSTRIGKGSETYISNLSIGNRNWDTGAKDICPDCARDFLVWWQHSNISAQYQLAKITSEMNSHEGHAQDTE